MTVKLFEPLELRGLRLANRIIVEPMTQFSAPDGVAADWHAVHLGQYALSGAGMVLTESTYVRAEARNTPECLSLYNDKQEAAIHRIADFYQEYGGETRFGVQLNHAGRKASQRRPWEGGGARSPEDGGYQTVAPSTIAFRHNWPSPRALTVPEIQEIVEMFARSAKRAIRSGCDVMEVNSAHGWLLHSFLSPVSNQRLDGYGGSLENRMRLLLEVFEAVRSVWPVDKPLGVRVSATDWIDGGWSVGETIELAKRLEVMGCDFIDISSGGLDPRQEISPGPGYQVAFAAAVKAAVRMAVVAVGQITDARQAESILRSGQADLIGLARIMLFNPRWPWQAAQELGVDIPYPPQYERARPKNLAEITSPENLIPAYARINSHGVS